MKYILFINFILWAVGFGIMDAITYCKKGAEAFTWNEHIILNTVRVLTLSMIILVYYSPKINIWWASAACLLAFSFWHNGFYYETRKRIDVPGYNFFSESTTSTAIIEVSFYSRLGLFLVGVAILILLT